ncbi:class D sortase [Neobacillus sp. LXY-4]|uniref:class D sortase n=1 Tax=Neobacillus sp. LXY-4 TaxID=3379826 RepID=UPI003EE19604
MKKLGNLFFLIGVSLLLFIVYAKGKTYFEQKKLIEEYTSLSFTEVSTKENPQQVEQNEGDAIGILQIPKIKLMTPIVEGASPENIRYAVGHLPSSSSINELAKKDKNFAIAGHRSYTYGEFFNRLNELNLGNKVIISTQNKVFTYKVFDKKIVAPSDIEVLNPIKGKSMITLITCHPEHSDKQRLIVFCELLSEKELD